METIFPDRCKSIRDAIDISWTLFSNKQPVATGNSRDQKAKGGYWGNSIGRHIGSFIGTKMTTYSLELNIQKNADELDMANPKVKIEVNPNEYEKRFYNHALLATFLIAVGLTWIMLIIGIKLRQRWSADRKTTN